MIYNGLISVDYNSQRRVAVAVRDPGMRYEIEATVDEVQTQHPEVQRILVYEGEHRAFDMRRRRRNSRWANVAGEFV